jgi:FKBP-type peptidyl-prolyl cis-trans isomerase FklB
MKIISLVIAGMVTTSLFAQAPKTAATKPTVTKPSASVTKPSSSTQKPAAGTAIVLKTNADSASYALGVRIAQNMKAQGFDKLNMAIFERAINDVLQNKPLVIVDAALDQCIGDYQQKISSAKAGKAKAEGQKFLAENGKRPGVITTKSGLQYEIVKAGTDTAKPTLTDKVKCHYHGTLINGQIFDSSVDRGEPITFDVNGVIAGWTEALQLMTVGSKWKLYVPSALAYGDRQAGPSIAPGSTLIFDVELIGIEK